MLIGFRYRVLWADPDGRQVQPRDQITREVHGDEEDPRSSQEVGLQAGPWVERVHGQAQSWLSWRPVLSQQSFGRG